MTFKDHVNGLLSLENRFRARILLRAFRELRASYRPDVREGSAPFKSFSELNIVDHSGPAVPVIEIESAFVQMGVANGDWLLVHASLSSFYRDGYVSDNGAKRRIRPGEYGEQILEMFQRLIGDEGLLMMPTEFVSDYAKASQAGERLSIAKGKSNRGTLTEIFRKMPGAYRSTSPVYTVSVLGHGLETAAANHWDLQYAMEKGSPWDEFAINRGKVVFFGCSIETNSFIHHPEYVLKNDYPLPIFFSRPHQFLVENVDGMVRNVKSFVHAIRWPAGTVGAFCRYLDEKYALYLYREVQGVPITLFQADRQSEALLSELRDGKTWYDAANW